jgi:hypothetical protein
MPVNPNPPSQTKRRRAPRADEPQLGSIDVAAEFFDVHPRTVRRMIHAASSRHTASAGSSRST